MNAAIHAVLASSKDIRIDILLRKHFKGYKNRHIAEKTFLQCDQSLPWNKFWFVLADMKKIFPFGLFHLGGDEVNTGNTYLLAF